MTGAYIAGGGVRESEEDDARTEAEVRGAPEACRAGPGDEKADGQGVARLENRMFPEDVHGTVSGGAPTM